MEAWNIISIIVGLILFMWIVLTLVGAKDAFDELDHRYDDD